MRFIIAVSLVIFSSVANAQWFTGKVQLIHSGPQYNGWVFVKVDGAVADKDACHDNANFDFSFEGTSDQGKLYTSMLLAAFSAKHTVTLKSVGDSCTKFRVSDLKNITLK